MRLIYTFGFLNDKILAFSIENVGEQSDVLMQAMTRYKSLTFPDKDITKDHTMTQLMGLNVKVLEPYKAMELKTDESCKNFHVFSKKGLLGLYRAKGVHSSNPLLLIGGR